MNTEDMTQSASRFIVLIVAVALALVALLITACSSGQASSSASSGSEKAGSSASAVEKSSESASSQAKSTVDRSGFVGTWNLIDMEKDGIRVSEQNPGVVDRMREENYLNISEDGFIVDVQDGQVFQSVWEASTPTEGIVAYGASRADAIPLVIDGDKLVYGPIDGVVLTFEKGDPRETPPLPEGRPDLREVIGD